MPFSDVIALTAITGNVTVGFAVLSYAGTLAVTVIADPSQCPEFETLTERLQHELDVMTDHAVAEEVSRPTSVDDATSETDG